ncbi:MAG: ROK family transcriptional regulator [Oscillospiraceae bacterium]|nr:ROK family transcriptional regulator [Oscillospiraceae bacterium]
MNGQVGNVHLMQKLNRLKVLSCIRKNPYIVRPAVAEQTGLSLASITNIVSFLIEKGLVVETGFENAERIGRKAVLLKFCPSEHNLICVSISQSRISVSLTDLDGKILQTKDFDFSEQSAKEALLKIKSGISALIAEVDPSKLLGIGIAVSALVLSDGTLAVSSKMRWDKTDLKGELEKEFNKPVFVTDSSVARAHYCNEFVSGENIRSMLFVDLVDGVGAVHFYEGHLNRSVIGEIGHTTVEKDGDECFCGNRGCLEIMCSLERAGEQYKKSGKGKSIDDVIKGYESGEKTAVALLNRAGEYLGIGMANAVNVLNPDAVIINAGQYQGCTAVLDVAIDEARRRIFSALSDGIEFKTAEISDSMMIEGMAQNLCECIFDINFDGEIF